MRYRKRLAFLIGVLLLVASDGRGLIFNIGLVVSVTALVWICLIGLGSSIQAGHSGPDRELSE